MEIATFTKESALNRQAYEQLRLHIRRENAGRYVAMAHGKLVGSRKYF